LNEALAINNAGQIVGFGHSPTLVQRAFLLNPVPEPAAVALWAAGLAVLSWRAARSRIVDSQRAT